MNLAEVTSHITCGETLLAVGDLEHADEQLTQASAKGALFGDAFDGMLATPMGDLRKRQWRFEEAREYYEQALHTSPAPSFERRPSAEIDLLAKLAETDVLTGRVDEALAWNDREQRLPASSSRRVSRGSCSNADR